MSVAVVLFCAASSFGQGAIEWEFTAKGCCMMCEDRIESALDVPGVRVAEWNPNTEKVFVVYKPKKVSPEALERLVADAGHDTESLTASDEVYAGIPDCCKYRSGCSGCSEYKKRHEGHDHDHDHDE